VPAHEGEPVACSLLAAGESVLSRSVKYHRPRSAYCFAAACSHCLMRVDGVPNVYTCQTPARPGMRLERQNAYPSAKVDAFEAIDWLFPRGLNHHEMFAGVPVAEQVMSKVARQLAGLGLLPDREAPARAAAKILRTHVAIVGGGPAGRAALETVLARGADAHLFEREPARAGSPAYPPTHHPRASVVGLYDDEHGRFLAVAALESGAPQLWKVYAERFVLAVGGHPSMLPFENNDLPGVIAGQALVKLLEPPIGIAPRRAALVGWGEALETTRAALVARGVEMAAVVAVREEDPYGVHGTALKAHGLARVSALSYLAAGKRVKVACDAVAVCLPPSPSFELARQGGARIHFDPQRESFAVEADADGRTHAPDVFVACGLTAEAASAAGRRAALAALGARS